MKDLLREIKVGFGTATSLYRLMAVNSLIFLIIQVVRLGFFFSGNSSAPVMYYASQLSLPADLNELLVRPWSLITYMFLHFSFMHIFFNMLVLYWTGRLFSEYLGNQKLWATYFLGGLTGAALYIAAYNVFPVFNESLAAAQLLGASVGVIAVLVAIATLLPDYTVHLLFFGAVRLKYIALFSIVLYAISIPDGNAGGNVAHLGGALFGFVMVKQLRKGRDLTSWLVRLAGRKKKSRLHVVESKKRRRSESDEEYFDRMQSRQEVIDRILDKISQSGYSSLTSEEKDILFKASKNIKE